MEYDLNQDGTRREKLKKNSRMCPWSIKINKDDMQTLRIILQETYNCGGVLGRVYHLHIVQECPEDS